MAMIFFLFFFFTRPPFPSYTSCLFVIKEYNGRFCVVGNRNTRCRRRLSANQQRYEQVGFSSRVFRIVYIYVLRHPFSFHVFLFLFISFLFQPSVRFSFSLFNFSFLFHFLFRQRARSSFSDNFYQHVIHEPHPPPNIARRKCHSPLPTLLIFHLRYACYTKHIKRHEISFSQHICFSEVFQSIFTRRRRINGSTCLFHEQPFLVTMFFPLLLTAHRHTDVTATLAGHGILNGIAPITPHATTTTTTALEMEGRREGRRRAPSRLEQVWNNK